MTILLEKVALILKGLISFNIHVYNNSKFY